MNAHSKTQAGLDGVVAAVTGLSHVDGERGELIVVGHAIGDLARRTDFEGLAARLWSIASGEKMAEADVRRWFGLARTRAFARLGAILPATGGMGTVEAFRAAVASLPIWSSMSSTGSGAPPCSGPVSAQ